MPVLSACPPSVSDHKRLIIKDFNESLKKNTHTV